MSLGAVNIGNLSVSKLILGTNTFSGFSHQGPEKDLEMKQYFTVSRIKDILKQAEALGINTVIARTDNFVLRVLMEYWNEGGTIQWVAQTCPELDSVDRSVGNAIAGKARACYIHGGQMDYFTANNKTEEIAPAIEKIQAAGLPAGVAGHDPRVFDWAEKNLNVDFYMCCYYNAAHRDEHAEHVSGMPEWFKDEDRAAMVKCIKDLKKPVIHYKILAAGRNRPEEGFAFAAAHLRPQDAVCVGVYTKDKPDMLKENLKLLEASFKNINSG
jgi:hypothetical protein